MHNKTFILMPVRKLGSAKVYKVNKVLFLISLQHILAPIVEFLSASYRPSRPCKANHVKVLSHRFRHFKQRSVTILYFLKYITTTNDLRKLFRNFWNDCSNNNKHNAFFNTTCDHFWNIVDDFWNTLHTRYI